MGEVKKELYGHFKNTVIQVCQGDLTTVKVDAIANPSNERLIHDGGLAAAVVRVGGQKIQTDCTAFVSSRGPLPVAGVAVTAAGSLPCAHVFHVVGPRWTGGDKGERDLLARAARRCFEIAEEMKLSSIAFPAISAGTLGFPTDECARVLVASSVAHLISTKASSLRAI